MYAIKHGTYPSPGNPSLKKAEALKLKKEAAELDSENIISSEGK